MDSKPEQLGFWPVPEPITGAQANVLIMDDLSEEDDMAPEPRGSFMEFYCMSPEERKQLNDTGEG